MYLVRLRHRQRCNTLLLTLSYYTIDAYNILAGLALPPPCIILRHIYAIISAAMLVLSKKDIAT